VRDRAHHHQQVGLARREARQRGAEAVGVVGRGADGHELHAQQAVTNGYGKIENLRAQPTSSSLRVVSMGLKVRDGRDLQAVALVAPSSGSDLQPSAGMLGPFSARCGFPIGYIAPRLMFVKQRRESQLAP
jgi:hypothetical protein